MDDRGGAAALAIINGWEWEGWTGFYDQTIYGPISRSLSEVVNKLAFEGHLDAPGAILNLLCDGKLTAHGNYRWRAYRRCEHFEISGDGDIPVRRWQELRDIQVNEGWSKQLDLPKIGMSGVEAFDWNWQSNRFSTAIMLGKDDDWGSGPYSEEFYSAWGIDLNFTPADNTHPAEAAPQPPEIARNRGRPPKWDWEGAIAHVVAVANTPNGLETGPGAQAVIERLIAGWFTRASNDASAPSESEIRKRASRIVKAIETLKSDKAKAA